MTNANAPPRDILDHLLRSAPAGLGATFDGIDAWVEHLAGCPAAFRQTPIDRALWAGFEADRLGYAFAGGYRAALSRLFDPVLLEAGEPPLASRVSLAATEKGGGHPKAIETTLSAELVLDGTKTFATLAPGCDEMLVVATRGAGSDGRNQLVVVRVRAGTPGVTIALRDPTPFAPEIPHARVTLAHVRVAARDVLPGDGYAAYLKPFRTVEDTHVLAASLAHVVRLARMDDLDPALAEGALALIVALRHVALAMTPDDPKAHLVLSGLFYGARRLIADHQATWSKLASRGDEERAIAERWQRDLGLLMIAEMARSKRTEAAWRSYASG